MVAIGLHRAHVNIMFARGTKLVAIDDTRLLEGHRQSSPARQGQLPDTQLQEPALAGLLVSCHGDTALTDFPGENAQGLRVGQWTSR